MQVVVGQQRRRDARGYLAQRVPAGMPVCPRDAGTFGCDDIGGNRCILLAHRKLLLTARRLASALRFGGSSAPINTSYGTVTYGAVSRLAGPECVTNSLRAGRAGMAAPG